MTQQVNYSIWPCCKATTLDDIKIDMDISSVQLRAGEHKNVARLRTLYQVVPEKSGNLARTADEITEAFVGFGETENQ